MNIDDYWLDDNQLQTIGNQDLSTPWDRQLRQNVWPQRYDGLVSSDTYRGCAIVLNALCAYLQGGAPAAAIGQAIEDLDSSLKISQLFPEGSHRLGGAALTVSNSWQSAHAGLTPTQLNEAFASELIYAAQKFQQARREEARGARLP